MFVPSAPENVGQDGLTVSNASDVCLVIFQHGSEGESEQDHCIPAISPLGTVPPVVGALSGESINGRPVLVYAPCTRVQPGWKQGQPREDYKFYKRGLELRDLLNRTEAAGYRRKSIIVCGHSAGAWIALTHLAQNPGSFAGVVAFSPAFAGLRSGHGYPQYSHFWVPERDAQIAILRRSPPASLVYSFDGDEFEPDHPLRAVFNQQREVIYRAMGLMPAKQTSDRALWNHNGAYHANFIAEKRQILDFIQRVTA